MKRRNFLDISFLASLGMPLSPFETTEKIIKPKRQMLLDGTFTIENNKISYFLEGLTYPLKIIHITDTHLWMDDQRGAPFLQYSERMAKAYNTTKHFETGEVTNPVKSFEEVLKISVEKKADLIAMTGDIFSFPSEAAIEWVHEKLKKAGIPYAYIAGNHDWHYEGMAGSSKQLREFWTNERLSLLYQGNNPMMGSYKIENINFITIDNSTYEIMPEQLEFFKEQSKELSPLVLLMHIPMYAPGRPISYGCGHPKWGEETDTLYKIERRERWPKGGHTKITFDFYKEIFSTPNLIGIFVGHAHSSQRFRHAFDLIRGIPQFFTDANATGAFTEINFLPLEFTDRELLLSKHRVKKSI